MTNKSLLFHTLVLTILIISCKSGTTFTNEEFQKFESSDNIGYYISGNNEEAGKLAFLLLEKPDTTDKLQMALIDILDKNGWRIVIPKPIGNQPQVIQTKDTRQTRLSTNIHIFYNLKEKEYIDTTSKVMVIGLKKQGYLAAQLSNVIRADNFININSGPHSYFYELTRLQYLEDTAFATTNEFSELYVINLSELRYRIKQVLKNNTTAVTLGSKTNADWLSYYNYQTAGDYTKTEADGVIMISRDYPFISKDSRIFLNALVEINASSEIKLYEMEGNGDYTKEEEIDILIGELKKILNNLH